jgi:hypothetical protein
MSGDATIIVQVPIILAHVKLKHQFRLIRNIQMPCHDQVSTTAISDELLLLEVT